MRHKWLPRLIQRHRHWIPYIVLAGTLSLTAFATSYVKHTAKVNDQVRFQNAIQRTRNSIENRLNTYVAMLRGGAGLFSAREPDRAQFRAYVNRLGLSQYYPGVQGIGFAKQYQASERTEITSALQMEALGGVDLVPSFNRSVYYPIIYLEPLDQRNQAALGYDMFTEPTRRAAMEKARDLAMPQASGKVTLVQEISERKQAGFLIYVPVYEGGGIPNTVAERREQLEGFVYSPFRVDDLMAGIFGTEPYPFVSFQIYDGTQVTPEALMYSSEEQSQTNYDPRLTATLTTSIANQPWTITFATKPAFDATSSIALVPLVTLGGTVVSLALFGITHSQIQARADAEHTAADLRRSEYNLQQSYEELEDRVKERTAELSQANRILEDEIAARQQAQEALEAQTTTLREQAQLLDLAYDSIFVRDLQGTILYWNQGAAQQYGWSAAEAIGKLTHTLLRTQFSVPFEEIETELLERNQWEGELIHHTRQGTTKIVASRWALKRDEAGTPLSILEINNDITQQKQAEQSLQQALCFAAMLQKITDKVRDSLDEGQILQTAVDALASGLDVIQCNTGVYNLEQGTSTITAESTAHDSSRIGEIIHLLDFPEEYTALLSGQNLALCFLHSAFGFNHVSVLACPVFDNEGVLGDLWLFRPADQEFNAFEIRLVEQVASQCAIALRQARLYETAQAQVKALERVNWLKDDFLSTVSHELRTPVSNMKLAIRMLELVFGQVENLNNHHQKADQYLQVLKTECQREIDLINDLLDLQRLVSGRQTLHLQTVDVVDWLPQLVEPFRQRAQARSQTLHLDLLSQPIPPLVADISSLERVLSELLNNACKYTPPDETIEVRVQAHSGEMLFSVCNSGTEIPESELPRIFDKFYRIPNADPWKQGGTGLGLALTQRLVEHMEGRIHVESAQGRTIFTVVIPNQRVLDTIQERV